MSRLEDKILAGLEDIGYSGPLLKYLNLQSASEIGQKSTEYTELVQFLTSEIKTLLSIDEEVNAVKAPEDAVAFVMEVTSFLRELGCRYTNLTQGLVSERLQAYSDRLLLLDYLITELMAARILQEKKPEKKIELKLQETPEGADMRNILQILRFPKPPNNITVKQLFDKLDSTVPLVLRKAGVDLVGQGMFNGFLSDKQWEILKNVQSDLNNEYKIRREMLLTRLDVTIQSFQWSDRTKGREHHFERLYQENRKKLRVDPDVDISDLIAARTDIAIIEKTSSANVRKNTKTPLNKIIIGQVPDRGGRSWEQAPPPPEMPSWQQNRAGPSGGARGGGGSFRGGRGRGDFQNNSFEQRRSYGGNNPYDNRDNYNSGFDSNRGSSSYGGRGGHGGYNNYNRRDSGGGLDYQQSKRPKTYDNFQANKSTYADQYVQENQHNQQYHRGGRGGGFHRGRSNYHRGGGGGYR